jgi:hypothetical protein
MIIISNFFTLCKYLINKTTQFTNVNYIEFEIDDKDDDDKDDDDEIMCNCNLCYTFRNIVFFITRYLKSKQI